jgi:hypothetical protein
MATSVLKKIVAEAKRLRQSNPKLKWTEAIKKAGAFYRGAKASAIKTTRKAKRTYKKGKAVASAVKKGYAVAKRSYANTITGINSKWVVINALGDYLTRKNLQAPFTFTNNVELAYIFTEEEAKQVAKGLSNWDKYASDKPIKAKQFKIADIGKIYKKKPKTKKVGAVKVKVSRSGKGSSKLGALKKVKTNQIKPVKPTFAILNKQNPAFLSSLVDNSRKPKGKILVYSPFLNRYIIIVKYVDMYTVYIVRPSQTIIFEEVYKVIGTHKNTLARINKTYDIDLIP